MNAALHVGDGVKVRGILRRNEPMAGHTSWRCGGTAARYFEPVDRDDLAEFLQRESAQSEALWLGLGSNLLVRDGGLEQTVIATAAGLTRFEWLRDDLLYAECGVTCARLAREGAAHDRAGLEFLAGIPGTLGGALHMNAGALGSDTWTFVVAVETINMRGQIVRREAGEYTPHYRHVSGPEQCFVGAWMHLPSAAHGGGRNHIRQVLAQRGQTQPTGRASCGSVFKNPEGDFAGRLIEQCGLKGWRVGGAEVSTVHANFIVNDGHASAADIEALISDVREEVRRQSGIELETEVQIVGRAIGAADKRADQ